MKTWFITGTSSGFGEAWMRAALDRGDQVTATALPGWDTAALLEQYGDPVLPLAFDVRDRAACRAAVAEAIERFGTLDILINNAGYGQLGMVEELSETEIREQLETNLLGPLWLTQAVLPQMRAQGHGRILQVSSIGGVLAYPFFGAYSASKWGLEAFSQSLSGEVRDFGIDVTIIEAVGYATNWWGSNLRNSEALPPYAALREAMQSRWDPTARRPPAATVPSILHLADMDNPPLRVLLGEGGIDRIEAEYAARLATWKSWDVPST